MTKIVCTSDLHGTLPDDLPDGDILIIGGDICPVWDHNRQYQAAWLRTEFYPWLASFDHNEKILIAGNHDFIIQESVKIKKELSGFVHYLEDESVTLDGIKFYGTPWVPVLARWAFYATDAELEAKAKEIPDDTQVLISHGPPFKNSFFLDGRYRRLTEYQLWNFKKRPQYPRCCRPW